MFRSASPGKRLPLGSDFPVEDINPLLGFYAAVARRSPEGTSPHGPGGWYVPVGFPTSLGYDSCLIPLPFRSHGQLVTTISPSQNRYREEALTRTQALRGMTCDAAYAAFAEDTRGRLVPGFAADFVVLDRDIMRVPLEEILDTRVLATVVDGQVAYGSL